MAHPDPDGQIPASPTQRLRLFELLAENAPDGIGAITLDGTITYANPALHAMLRSDTSIVGLTTINADVELT
jgi:PAS domain-containing protein